MKVGVQVRNACINISTILVFIIHFHVQFLEISKRKKNYFIVAVTIAMRAKCKNLSWFREANIFYGRWYYYFLLGLNNAEWKGKKFIFLIWLKFWMHAGLTSKSLKIMVSTFKGAKVRQRGTKKIGTPLLFFLSTKEFDLQYFFNLPKWDEISKNNFSVIETLCPQGANKFGKKYKLPPECSKYMYEMSQNYYL